MIEKGIDMIKNFAFIITACWFAAVNASSTTNNLLEKEQELATNACSHKLLKEEINQEQHPPVSLTTHYCERYKNYCKQYKSYEALSKSQPKSSHRPYWLLSLDAGGVRGLIELEILSDLENKTNKSVFELFDGIAGSSIGGVIACLLTLPDPNNPSKAKYSATDLLNIMKQSLPQMFDYRFWSFGGVFGVKYHTSSVENLLNELIGDSNFKNSLLPTTVVATKLDTYTEKLFSTTDTEDYLTKNIARATSAAPTYFAPVSFGSIGSNQTSYYTDGAMCMNNPTIAGIALLNKKYGVSDDNVNVFSIGCGITQPPYNQALLNGGQISWATTISTIFLAGQLSSADSIIRFYCGDRYHRFSPYFGATQIELDDISQQTQNFLTAATQGMLKEKSSEYNYIISELIKNESNKKKI